MFQSTTAGSPAICRSSAFLCAVFVFLLPLAVPGKTTINFWAVTGGIEDIDMFRRLATKFESRTGIGVNVTFLSWSNFYTKYFTAMASGIPPDVGATNLGGPADYGSVGGIVDLYSEFPGEGRELEERFFPGIMPCNKFRNKLFGIPAEATTAVLFFRTDIFDSLKIPLPETWSQLQQAIYQLESNGLHYAVSWPAYSAWSLGLFTMAYGLPQFSILDDGELRVNWTDPRYQKATLYALDQWHMHDVPTGAVGNRLLGMFKSNDPEYAVPLMVDLIHTYNKLTVMAPEIKGKWDILPWPKADDGASFNLMGGTSYVIFRDSRHKRAAFEWLKFLNTVEAQQDMILDRLDRGDASSLFLSPVMDVWSPEHDDFWSRGEIRPIARLRDVMKDVMVTFRTTPTVLGLSGSYLSENSLLERAGIRIIDGLTAIAGKNGLGRWQLIQEMAKGNYAQEKRTLDRHIEDWVRTEYAKIAPQALADITREADFYEERYGRIIDNVQEYRNKKDILTYVKWAMFLILAGLAVFIVMNRRSRKHALSYAFVAPPVMLISIFIVIPAVTALYLSFTQYNAVLPLSTARWVGLKHYIDITTTGKLFLCIWRTVKYVIMVLPATICFSLILAALLNNKLLGQRYWRFLYFSPMVTSVVSISLIFTQLFLAAKSGWLNAFLLNLGLVDDPVQFLTDGDIFMYCVAALGVWGGLAFNTLIFLAGLQQVPAQLYEAAEVDGAGWFHKFWHVSLPGVRPQILFTVVMGLIWGFQVFEIVYMLGGGSSSATSTFGPNESGMTMVPYIYHTGFQQFKMGRSSAVAYVLFAIILVFTVTQIRLFGGKAKES